MVKLDIHLHFVGLFKLLVLTSTQQLFVRDSMDLNTRLVITCVRYESIIK